MDKLVKYRDYVKEIMRGHATYSRKLEEFETQLLFDDDMGHYYLMRVGWDGLKRIHACLLHIDLKDGKIWIQRDGVEEGVTKEFLDRGVPKEDIVLAFHAPYKRKFTGYATA
ncbi:MAG: XisI protein [Bacteroidia bacterium]|nr:XisI protein [Bacteroidia bacterium]